MFTSLKGYQCQRIGITLSTCDHEFFNLSDAIKSFNYAFVTCASLQEYLLQ